MTSTLNGRSLAVLTNNTAFDSAFREYSILSTRSTALHDVPELRQRLGDNDRSQVERIVRRDFIDVEPWPFAALLEA